MKTPIQKHPNYVKLHGELIKALSRDLGCSVYCYYEKVTDKKYEKLVKLVCEEYGITRSQLFLKTRKGEVIEPRMVFFYLIKGHIDVKGNYLQAMVSGDIVIDRTTMYSSFKRIKGFVEVGDPIRERILRIINKL